MEYSPEEIIAIPEKKHSPLPGITEWINEGNGFTCIDLTTDADPAKRSDEWKLTTRAGMPKAEYDREYGNSWIVYDGKPVYQDYQESVHMYNGPIIGSRKQKLICGIDAGPNDVYIGWTCGLVNVSIPAVLWIDEFLQEDGDIPTFFEIITSRLRMEWAKLGGFVTHIVDQAAFTPSRVQSKTAVVDIARQYKIYPLRGEISFSGRRQSVEQMLTRPMSWTDDGRAIPRWRVHERCPILREAMQGGYHYPKNQSGIGDTFKPLPVKNKFSHVANAMEYACSRMDSIATEIPFQGKKLPRMNRI